MRWLYHIKSCFSTARLSSYVVFSDSAFPRILITHLMIVFHPKMMVEQRNNSSFTFSWKTARRILLLTLKTGRRAIIQGFSFQGQEQSEIKFTVVTVDIVGISFVCLWFFNSFRTVFIRNCLRSLSALALLTSAWSTEFEPESAGISCFCRKAKKVSFCGRETIVVFWK